MRRRIGKRRWGIVLPAVLLALAIGQAPVPAVAQEGGVERLMREGMAARRAGDFASATARFEDARTLVPQDSDILFQLGLVYGFQERFADAEATLREAAELAPASAEIALALARVQAWQGRFDAAAAAVDAILARDPDDLEALAFAARIALYRERPDEAADRFRAIVGRDPDHVEGLVGLGDALAAAGDMPGARAAWARAAALAPDQREIADRLARGPEIGPRWRLDSTVSYSDLSQGRRSWRETTHRLAWRRDPRTTLQGGFDVNERYGLTDVFLTLGAQHRATDWLHLRGQMGGTPNAHFRERWTVGGGFSARLGETPAGTTVAITDARLAHYDTGSVLTVSPGIEHYLPGGVAWLTLRAISTNDEGGRWTHGWLARADLQATAALRFYAGLSDAPETQENLTIETSAVFVGARFALSETVSLVADYTRESRQSSYRRDAFTLGIGLAF